MHGYGAGGFVRQRSQCPQCCTLYLVALKATSREIIICVRESPSYTLPKGVETEGVSFISCLY